MRPPENALKRPQNRPHARQGRPRSVRDETPPLQRLLDDHAIRRIELASAAGTDVKTVDRICQGRYAGLKIGMLCRVAVALGVAPVELIPLLGARPRCPVLVGQRSRPRAPHSAAGGIG